MDMGTQNKRSGTIRDIELIENKRIQFQTAIDRSKSIESRRRFGQFATPIDLAKEIVSYGLTLQDDNELSFLEPALGTGAFYSALLSECGKQSKNIKQAVGVELDDDFYSAALNLWGDTNINLVNNDFTETECLENINFLICNPPYVRHHYITKEQKTKLSSILKEETGLSFSGLAGLYCYFILLAHKWLAPNAICGWLIPSEFMDVNYGNTLKQYLLSKVHLLRVHRYNPENCKFDDALVSSCVVWFKNETIPGDYEIDFSYGGTHKEPEISKKVCRSTLEKVRKWTHFPKKEYISENDWIQRFINDCCIVGELEKQAIGVLYKAYQIWAKENGEFPKRNSDFSQALQMAGFKTKRNAKCTEALGVSLDPEILKKQNPFI